MFFRKVHARQLGTIEHGEADDDYDDDDDVADAIELM